MNGCTVAVKRRSSSGPVRSAASAVTLKGRATAKIVMFVMRDGNIEYCTLHANAPQSDRRRDRINAGRGVNRRHRHCFLAPGRHWDSLQEAVPPVSRGGYQ